jgi:hypothetical protein
MPRGRPKLTLREKLTNKVARLQKEIEAINAQLVGLLDVEVAKTE